ncbi:MAG: XrtA/PEP-CTERM system histidine kinase PrsK [Sedimenticola sp.]
MNLGAISYFIAFIAFLVLSTLLVISWRKHAVSSLTILASISSMIWAGASASSMQYGFPIFDIVHVAELARDASWCFFLLSILKSNETDRRIRWIFRFTATLTIVSALIVLEPFIGESIPLPGLIRSEALLFAWVVFSIMGLFLVEQLFRNATHGNRWAIKHIGLGLGGLFAYDFFMFSDALLFKQLNVHLWNARGIINGFMVPLIAISIARNPKWKLDIHVSRQVVFHSTTFLGAGIYLLLMAGAGYYIRSFGGQWGITLQIIFLSGAVTLLFILLFSGRIRAKIRVLLSKHFFSYKYDYREEWLKFSKTLAASEEEVPERLIHAIAAFVNSQGGTLWVDKKHRLELLGRWCSPDPGFRSIAISAEFRDFFERKQWILDLHEHQSDPDVYDNLDLPKELEQLPDYWLAIPLFSKDKMQGVILLRESETQQTLNWEDRDLLKTAAQQASIYLAQYQSDRELMEARQFEAFHRLSAYVIHDLKNILAQQSLLLTNAEKHKHKPEFIADVFKTIESSVVRMTRLMEQMQSGIRGNNPTQIDLKELLASTVERHSNRQPVPELILPDDPVNISADYEQLSTVFGHLIQNAQEATEKSGNVLVSLTHYSEQAIIEVEDDGHGMDDAFIRERLFKPFDSTKGLTGMGIGVFESRELIRALGGEISVTSSPGEGTRFHIELPCTSS